MAMGIVKDDEFDAELERLTRKNVAQVLQQQKVGRQGNEVPEALRNVIAEEALESTPAEEIKKAFGISQSSISAYKLGATSTASIDTPNPTLNNHLKKIRNRISSKASKTIMRAIDCITDEKLQKARPDTLASVAKSLSGVVRDMEPPSAPVQNSPGVAFMVYAPQFKSEKSFDVITVNE